MPATNAISLLRRVAQIEGISFLVLLFIAMPLKYFAGQPLAVKIVGWIHGVLFVLFGLALLRAWIVAKPPFPQVVWIFTSGLLPFGPFFADRTLVGWEKKPEEARV
ncbi:MAG: DUF3817 domain-containing protein [Verrucomicrobia bacterium]|nr:DUF3817 domain-containing protein [Verrucomicrobiota bacterium]